MDWKLLVVAAVDAALLALLLELVRRCSRRTQEEMYCNGCGKFSAGEVCRYCE